MTSRPEELEAAILELWRKLQIADEYNPTLPDHGRSSARIALIGVLEFLAVLFPDRPSLPVALQDLLQGLVDLDQGTVVPLLEPTESKGRPPNPLSEELFRALPAAAMTVLMERGGMDRERAAREVARRLSKLGYRRGNISYSNIAKWREKMMTERAAENLAVQRYELGLQSVKDMEPGKALKLLVDNLPTLHPAEFANKRDLNRR